MSLQKRFDQLEDDIRHEREQNKDDYLNQKDDDWYFDDTPITFDIFQDSTFWSKERNPKNIPADIFYAIGLAGESGELLNYVKKQYRSDNGELTEKRLEQIEGEIADILWYLSAYAKEVGIQMSHVAARSQKKMLVRLKEWKKENE